MPSTKRCTKCGEVKPLDAFHRNRRGALGRQSRCRSCLSEYARARYEANRDRIREANRAWREANRDRVRERSRAWHEANRDRKREYNRAWYEANRDHRRKYRRAWYEANRDRIREYNREYNRANRDRHRAWYEANRDHRREYRREHYVANRDRYYEYAHRRRARKRAATVEELSPADVYTWWDELGAYTCFWCDLPFTEDDRIHVDHVWPLSRGGHHAVRNLVPTCERCNLAKHASLPHEFAERAYEEWLALTSE